MAAAVFEGVCLVAVRREINMRVGGGRILLDGYQIGLYFLSEGFVLGFLPWKTIKQIFNIIAYSCDYRFRLQNSLGIGKLISHSHILTLCIQCYEG